MIKKEWRTIVAVALSGVLWICAFPKIGLWPLVFVALVPLLFVLDGRSQKQVFWLTFATTFFAHTGLVYWLVYTINHYGHIPLPAAILIFVLMLIILSAIRGFFFAVPYALCRGRAPAYLLVPVLWVGADYFQALFLGGFPWEFFGYAPYRFLPLVQAADILGVWLLTMAFVFVNASIYEALRPHGRGLKRFGGLIASVLLIALLLAYGQSRLRQVEGLMAESTKVRVAVVQGNIPQDVKWSREYRRVSVERYGNLSAAAAAEGAELIVWPETAVPKFQDIAKPLYRPIAKAARLIDRYLLIGLPTKRFEGEEEIHHNSACIITPEGKVLGWYHKNRLVPFGEFIPFKKVLKKLVDSIAQATGDFDSGHDLKVLEHPRLGKIAVIICYEAIYPNLCRKLTRQGVRLLVNITNDAWFGNTSAPHQHLSMAAVRAVESRLYMARAANTGISSFVEPTGRIVYESGLYELEYEVNDVGLVQVDTTYERVGDVLPLSCLAFSIVSLLVIILRRFIIKRL